MGMGMNITLEEVLATLSGGGRTLDDLINLVRTVCGAISGEICHGDYLFYSGLLADHKVARTAAGPVEQSSQGHIDDLLQSTPFRIALMRAIQLDVLGNAYAKPVTPQEIAEINERLGLFAELLAQYVKPQALGQLLEEMRGTLAVGKRLEWVFGLSLKGQGLADS
jgi:hypothetical protein